MADGIQRRDFLKVLGASGAGAATAGCSTGEVERLIPYVIPAEDIVPGVPTWYASTCRECPAGCGIHVETHSGRVTKIEGNPAHPVSRGNLCARGQASVQGLYHPDRFTGPISRELGVQESQVTWSVAERVLADRIRAVQAAGRSDRIVFLSRDYTGSMEALVDEWVSALGARRVVYDPWADQPRDLRFADARLIVAFGADFLETWGSPVEYAWQFAQMHSYRAGQRGKFIWVGPHRPLTGLNADEWIAPKPGTEHLLAMAMSGDVDLATAAADTEIPQERIASLAREFTELGGVALGPGTALSGRNAGQLQAAVDSLNGGGAARAPTTSGPEVLDLVQRMAAGEVEVLLVDAPDPAYTLPGSLEFVEAMHRVPTRVSFSTFPDRTALHATLILPDHHFLEAWGDYVPSPGVYGLVQPAMRPVFNTKQAGDVLLSVANQLGLNVGAGASTFYDYLRSRWTGLVGGTDGWRQALKDGGTYPGGVAVGLPAGPGLEGTAAVAPAVLPATPPAITPAPPAPAAAQAFEGEADANFHLVVYPSYRFYDGRTANRPWLLELPDPVTKVSWDSWVEMHPDSAEELGLDQGDLVEITSPYGSLATRLFVYPGVRRDTVAIQTGLGHEAFGRFTEGRGVNPNVLLGPIVDETTGRLGGYGIRVRVEPAAEPGSRILGAITAGEGYINPPPGLFEAGTRIQADREIAQAISVAELTRLEQEGHPVIPGEGTDIETLRGGGGFVPAHTETDPSGYPPPGTHYGEYVEGATRWAMAVDLERCIGCSACVTACYAENNIPVVGPTEVKKGRELSWLRIERYFRVGSDEEDAYEDVATDDVRFLPMMCQHCGNAPCEPVCPVYAAYHTPDGLNGQIYNRCVGTRYCANNCPYKVRYFNWWTYEFPEPLNWQLNPDVAVREKGVMEKCTFCVQRIRQAEHVAALENRPVRDGEVVPACVQTCPTEVFVFGDISDPQSKVAQAARTVRGYRVLDLLNTQSAVVYLKKVTLQEPEHGGHHAPAAAEEHGAPEAH